MTQNLVYRRLTLFLTLVLLCSASPRAYGNNHKPTLAQIEAAKKLELEKKQTAAKAAKKIGCCTRKP